jgi:hypothetical protein
LKVLLKVLISSLFLLYISSAYGQSSISNCSNLKKYNSSFLKHINEVIKVGIKKNGEDSQLTAPSINQQLTFSKLLPILKEGNCPSDSDVSKALEVGYEFVLITHKTFQAIGLQPAYQIQDYGWGSFFFKVGAEDRAVIEIVHPLNDTFTAEIGARVFEASSAHAYFISGSHRRAYWDHSHAGHDPLVRDLGNDDYADPSDIIYSFFQVAHKFASKGPVLTIQIHAFGNSTASKFPDNEVTSIVDDYNPYTNYTSRTKLRPLKAIISNGAGRTNPHCLNIENSIEDWVGRAGAFIKEDPNGPENMAHNFVSNHDSGNYLHNGSDYRFLAATRNVQGQYIREFTPDKTGFFCHVELSREARSIALKQDLTVLALSEAINKGTDNLTVIEKNGLIWSPSRESSWHNFKAALTQDWATLPDNVTKTYSNDININQSLVYDFKPSSSDEFTLTTTRPIINEKGTADTELCTNNSKINLDFLPKYDDDAVKSWTLEKGLNVANGWNFGIQSSLTTNSSRKYGISAKVQTLTEGIFGLSNASDSFNSSTNVAYGFKFDEEGNWKIYRNGQKVEPESDIWRLPFGKYEPNDVFIISVDGNYISFYQDNGNGPKKQYLMSSPYQDQRLHASISNPGGKFSNIKASFANDINSLRKGSVLLFSKHSNMQEGWNFAAQSSQYLPLNTDGKAKIVIADTPSDSVFGFESTTKPFHKSGNIDYGFRFYKNGTWKIIYKGKQTNFDGNYKVNDRFIIKRLSNRLTFIHGSKVVATLDDDLAKNLKLHIAISSINGAFDKIYSSFIDGELVPLKGSDTFNLIRTPRRLDIDALYVFKNNDVAFSLNQDFSIGMINYEQCKICRTMRNGEVFRYHKSGVFKGKITRILREASITDKNTSGEDNIDALHVIESNEGLIESMLISYTKDNVGIESPSGEVKYYKDGDLIQVYPSGQPYPGSISPTWTGSLYLSESSYLSEGSDNGTNEDLNAVSSYRDGLIVSYNSSSSLDTDSSESRTTEQDNNVTFSNRLGFSDGAAIYIRRNKTSSMESNSPVEAISVFREQGELFSNNSYSNRYHSDVGALHSFICESNTIEEVNTSQSEFSMKLTIPELPYKVYLAKNGTMYLASEDMNNVFILINDGKKIVILNSSEEVLKLSGAQIINDTTIAYKDINRDGYVDVLIDLNIKDKRNILIVNSADGEKSAWFVGKKNVTYVHTDLLGSPVLESTY